MQTGDGQGIVHAAAYWTTVAQKHASSVHRADAISIGLHCEEHMLVPIIAVDVGAVDSLGKSDRHPVRMAPTSLASVVLTVA